MAPEYDALNNSALFSRLWSEADEIPTVFLGLDAEYDGSKGTLGELGLASYAKGSKEPIEVVHVIIRAHLRSKPKPLAALFGSSVEVANHEDLITYLNDFLAELETQYQRVVILGCNINSDTAALRNCCDWELSTSCPFPTDNFHLVDIQQLAMDGLLVHHPPTFKLTSLVRALGKDPVGPNGVSNYAPFHNAAHDAYWTGQCAFVQGDLDSGVLRRAVPLIAPPPAPQTQTGKRKREDESPDQDNLPESTSADPLQPQVINTSASVPTANQQLTIPKPPEAPLDSSTHQSPVAMAITRAPHDTPASDQSLAAYYAKESQAQRDFMMAMQDKMDARQDRLEARQDRKDAREAAREDKLAHLLDKAVDTLTRLASRNVTGKPEEPRDNSAEKRGGESAN